MKIRYTSSAMMSLVLLCASIPANGKSVGEALLNATKPCNYTAVSSLGQARHVDTLSHLAYKMLSRGKAFPLRQADKTDPGIVYAVFDIRHQILGVYLKHYTWGDVTLKRTRAPMPGLPNLDLSNIGTVTGIKIGASDSALSRLPGPKATWICGGARQILYIDNCDSIQFTVVAGRVVAIESGFGGC